MNPLRFAEERTDYRFLDATRLLSAWLVVLFHVRGPHLQRLFPFVRNGYLAVDYFFALSGFVMALRYRDEIGASTIGFGRFLGRRLARIWPLHVATMIIAWLLVVARRTVPAALGGPLDVHLLVHEAVLPLPVHLLLAQAFGLFHELTLNGVSWSVSAEMVAYVVFFASARIVRGSAALAAVWLATTVACCLWLVRLGALDVTYAHSVYRCLAGFGVGVVAYLGAEAARFRRLALPSGVVWTALAVFASPLAVFGFHAGEPYKLLGVWAIFLLLVFVEHPVSRWYARSEALRRASERSYAIYLVHGAFLLALGYATARLPAATFRPKDVATELALVVGFVAFVEGLARVMHARVEVPARTAWLARLG